MMRGENESIQNDTVVQKVLDTLKMLCVVLGLPSPKRNRVVCVCACTRSFSLFCGGNKDKNKSFVHKKRITGRIKERNIRVLLSIL